MPAIPLSTLCLQGGRAEGGREEPPSGMWYGKDWGRLQHLSLCKIDLESWRGTEREEKSFRVPYQR